MSLNDARDEANTSNPALDLREDGEGLEYTLKEGHEWVWILVGPYSVKVSRTNFQLSCEVYSSHDEDDGPLARCEIPYEEA